jgi:cytochrome c-type biogenesis protein CcmH
MRPLDDGQPRRAHRESTKESIVAGYTGRSLAMAGGIIGIAAVAAYFGVAHIGEPDQGGGSIAGQVQIAPNLADQVKPTDVLFVIVRRPTGPPRPIAANGSTHRNFPCSLRLRAPMSWSRALS